jgi:hypothetical protein
MARKRLYTLDENCFDTIDKEDKAYWFGFILTDGSITSKINTVLQIKLKADDSHHLEKFNSFIQTDKPLTFLISKSSSSDYKDTKAVQQIISSKKIVKDLIANGCPENNKSKELTFPNIRVDLERHFIRGLIDGDGSFYTVKGKKESHQSLMGFSYIGTESMVTGFSEKVKFLNCGKIYKEKRVENCFYFSSVLTQSNAKLLREYLYSGASYFLDRKYEKITNYITS